MGIRDKLQQMYRLEGKQFIITMYQQLLQREPDPQGLADFLAVLQRGASKKAIIGTLLGGQEAANLYVPSDLADDTTMANTLRYLLSLDEGMFIEGIYREVLSREPKPEEVLRHRDGFRKDNSRMYFIREIFHSIEPDSSVSLAVNWSSLVNLPVYGYCNSSKNLMMALYRNGVGVNYRYAYGPGTPINFAEAADTNPQIAQFRQRSYDPGSPEVIYAQGDAFFKNQGVYKIGFTMLEVDGLPEEWVRQCNLMDEVWVPSQFNVETFQDSGVKVPMHIIPLGIDPRIYNPATIGTRYSPKFTFLTVFQWQERKNPYLLIEAFLKGFGHLEDAVLVLKTTQRIEPELRDAGYAKYLGTKIFVDSRTLPEHNLGSIYRGADCFVFPTSGEGWGMPILEAMACGIPTIATDWSAQREFLNEETGYPIRVKSLKGASSYHPYYRDFRWAEPDQDHLIERMMDVYEKRDSAHERSRRIAEKIVTKWTWNHSAEKMIQRLQAIKGSDGR